MALWSQIWSTPRMQGDVSLRQLYADNLSHNIGLITSAAKVVAICAVIAVALWCIGRLFSPSGGRLARLVTLWFRAKERELARRAGEDKPS